MCFEKLGLFGLCLLWCCLTSVEKSYLYLVLHCLGPLWKWVPRNYESISPLKAENLLAIWKMSQLQMRHFKLNCLPSICAAMETVLFLYFLVFLVVFSSAVSFITVNSLYPRSTCTDRWTLSIRLIGSSRCTVGLGYIVDLAIIIKSVL